MILSFRVHDSYYPLGPSPRTETSSIRPTRVPLWGPLRVLLWVPFKGSTGFTIKGCYTIFIGAIICN